MAGLLHGIDVIRFGPMDCWPLSALLLANQGVEVGVDPHNGPRWQSPTNAILLRGKKRITHDLNMGADLTLAGALIAPADVLSENFRPDSWSSYH